MLALAIRAFPSAPDAHALVIVRLCFVVEDRDADLYVLGGRPKTVEETMDRMQYYQNSR